MVTRGFHARLLMRHVVANIQALHGMRLDAVDTSPGGEVMAANRFSRHMDRHGQRLEKSRQTSCLLCSDRRPKQQHNSARIRKADWQTRDLERTTYFAIIDRLARVPLLSFAPESAYLTHAHGSIQVKRWNDERRMS